MVDVSVAAMLIAPSLPTLALLTSAVVLVCTMLTASAPAPDSAALPKKPTPTAMLAAVAVALMVASSLASMLMPSLPARMLLPPRMSASISLAISFLAMATPMAMAPETAPMVADKAADSVLAVMSEVSSARMTMPPTSMPLSSSATPATPDRGRSPSMYAPTWVLMRLCVLAPAPAPPRAPMPAATAMLAASTWALTVCVASALMSSEPSACTPLSFT